MSDNGHVERIGLYLMVIGILFNTCVLDTKINQIEQKIDKIKVVVQQ